MSRGRKQLPSVTVEERGGRKKKKMNARGSLFQKKKRAKVDFFRLRESHHWVVIYDDQERALRTILGTKGIGKS